MTDQDTTQEISDTVPLDPAEIRRIRRRLGLTQAKAGRVLGGGPRAFNKYEAGTVKPSAPAAALLRLLDENPQLMRDSGSPLYPSPFEVNAEDITALSRDLPSVLRRLLHAEALSCDLPADGIHVASNTFAPDGGEDGRIRWEGGPARTPFLPSRFCQFQIKGRRLTPASAGKEVLRAPGDIKPMVRAALEGGGHYILVCSQPYSQQGIQTRENRIRDAVRRAGLTIPDDRIVFRDASQVAAWVNTHPAVAVSVLERTRPGLIGPFGTWSMWRDRVEHSGSPWVPDERLPTLMKWCARAQKPQAVVRIVGLAGIGKSRLILEALGPQNLDLADLVLYAVESESRIAELSKTVRSLALAQARAIVVIDECTSKSHQILAKLAQHKNSSLAFISLGDQVPTDLGPDEDVLSEAPSSVIAGILDRIEPAPYPVDKTRFTRFASGFPHVAVELVSSWERRQRLPVTDHELVDDFVLGRDSQERDVRLRSAALVASFGRVGMDPTVEEQRLEVASFGRGLTANDLYSSTQHLLARRVGRRRGRYATLEPRPVALNLAERQWRAEWTHGQWDQVLAGSTSLDLKMAAAKNLALLNATPIAAEVVSYVLRTGGPFDRPDLLVTPEHLRILEQLTEIGGRAVSERIEAALFQIEDLTEIKDDKRRSLVEIARKLAFDPDTFAAGAQLLLRLAVAENESWANNATGCFRSLFPVHLGDTAADGNARLRVLANAAATDDPQQRRIIVSALREATETEHFTRMVGAEIRGSLPSLQPWRPAGGQEHLTYVQSCIEQLLAFALETDCAAEEARSGLGHALRGLVGSGYIETVGKVVDSVCRAFGSWPEAAESLGAFLAFDSGRASQELVARVRSLVERLHPADLELRVRELVTNMPWHYLCDEDLDLDEQQVRQDAVVKEIAFDVAKDSQLLHRLLPSLSQGQQRKTFEFGRQIALRVTDKRDFLGAILLALKSVPIDRQDPQLLAGYLGGLANSHLHLTDLAKRNVVQCPEIRHHFAYICSSLGVQSEDIGIVTSMLQSDELPVRHLQYWTRGEQRRLPAHALLPLYSVLMNHSQEGYWVAVNMLYRFMDERAGTGETVGVPIRDLLHGYVRWNPRGGYGQTMDDFYFEGIVGQILDRGRDDSEARMAALTLATEFVRSQGSDLSTAHEADRAWRRGGFASLLKRLLSEFPDITWPLVGGAIVSNKIVAWRMAFTLGTATSIYRAEEPTISSLPEETVMAWCRAHKESAPAFACRVVPILAESEDQSGKRSLHPLMRRLIDEFGEHEAVQSAVIANLHHCTHVGSMSTYFAAYIPAFRGLEKHPNVEVQSWAARSVRGLSRAVEQEKQRDEEEAMDTE